MRKRDKGCRYSRILKQDQKDNSMHKIFYVETQIRRKPQEARRHKIHYIGESTTIDLKANT